MNLEKTQNGLAELRAADGRLVTAYRYDDFGYYPHCHPVMHPGGVPLTLANPGDHPWHSGAAFA